MKKILPLYFLLLKCFFVYAQPNAAQNNLHFDRIGTENGLSFPTVYCLLQDSRGFIWVGTTNGLNRYDGNSFVIYRRDPGNTNSLADNEIRSLAEDADGNIWMGTTKGVSVLNPYRDQFINFHHDDADTASLSDDYINHVFADREKNIWTGNPGGIDQYDSATHQFHHITLQDPEGNHLRVSCFCEQNANHFWIGTNDGLLLFDKRTKKYDYLKAMVPKDFLITSLLKDTLGNLWIGTWANGAFRFDVNEKKFTQYKFNFTGEYTSATNIVLAVEQTATSEKDFSLWFGTTEGLVKMPVKNGVYATSFTDLPFYKNDPLNPNSLSANGVNDLLNDANGTLWIATDFGLDKTIPGFGSFQSLDVSGSVYKTLVEKNDRWITTWYGTGVTRFDSSWKEIERFTRVPPQSTSLDNGQVSTICRDENGILWMATFHGLVSYDEKKKKFTEYLHDETDSSSLSENRITYVFHDSKNRLWVATYNAGLNMKPPNSEGFVHYFHDEKNLHTVSNNKIWMITEDRLRRVWIGTNYGLSRYDDATNSFTSFLNDKKNGGLIIAVYMDKAGRMWASTKQGFYQWNNSKNDFEAVMNPKELNDATIYSILDDRDGDLWLTSQKGLIRYNPERKSLMIFDRHDGLPFDDLTGSFDKDSLNRFYIGGNNKLITFSPSDLNLKFPPPEVCVTSLKIFDRSFPVDSLLKSGNTLCLPYNQNMLTFQFTAPNFIHAERIQFAYRMNGLDKRWNFTGTNQMATYSSLPPGEYIFSVKATSIDGEWSDKEATVHITITPPFWKTWWFLMLTALLLAFLLFIIIRYRIGQIKKREEEKTLFNKQLAEVEMKALRAQMNPHFIFNALNSVQECVITNQTDAAYNYLSKFSKLVRLILENSEQSLVPIKKEMEALRLYLDLESLRFQNFSYTITIDKLINQEDEKIPAMLFQPFAENSIKHGLATKEGNRFLKIELYKDQNKLRCIVEDNGVGRAKSSELKTTFRRDHESKGMKITEDRIRLIGVKNKIDVHLDVVDLYDAQQQPAGTRVEIEIPYENEN